VPCGSTQVERRAIRESALGAGASKVYLIEEPMAAAIGADLPVGDATGSMVVDIGGGTTEVGVISLAAWCTRAACASAATSSTRPIVNYIRRNYGMLIGETTAEQIKKTIGSAFPGLGGEGNGSEGPQPRRRHSRAASRCRATRSSRR
jgi:rod shape-determining protein MreB